MDGWRWLERHDPEPQATFGRGVVGQIQADFVGAVARPVRLIDCRGAMRVEFNPAAIDNHDRADHVRRVIHVNDVTIRAVAKLGHATEIDQHAAGGPDLFVDGNPANDWHQSADRNLICALIKSDCPAIAVTGRRVERHRQRREQEEHHDHAPDKSQYSFGFKIIADHHQSPSPKEALSGMVLA